MFANDVDNPQLWAVTANVNSDKGHSTPDEWRPPLSDVHCEYAAAWITVKAAYGLTVSSAEHSALDEMLDTC